MRHVDVLSIGEALVDLISDTEQSSLIDSRTFTLYPGGAVTNVALNTSRLGGAAAIVARVGDDDFGVFLRRYLAAADVDTTYLHTTPRMPTTLIIATRHIATPQFALYRGADAQMLPEDMPLTLLQSTSLVHTSAFALSREPTRSSILEFVSQAHVAGCLISFDPNYEPRIWEMHANPLSVFEVICSRAFLAKPSLDDCIRIFGAGKSPEAYATYFLDLGVQQVVLTMGSTGVLHANAEGYTHYPMPEVEVVDVTGAGDCFWAGLLLATLDGYPLADAIRVAQEVVAIKLRQVGPLSSVVDRTALYVRLGLQKT
ncbi:MAG TPA: sugar kinase [Ktedonobacteraceae bacterium]